MAHERIALVLAGGAGRRLWPFSTAARPKPFRKLFGEGPPIALALRQAAAWAGHPSRVLVALGDESLGAARDAVSNFAAYRHIVERHPVETAVAIARAALSLASESPRAVLIVMAADQRLSPDEAVLEALNRAASIARDGPYLVSLGVAPQGPSTAYGYMRLGAPIGRTNDAWEGLGYVEKPDTRTAARLVAEGCLWNAGTFAFRVDTLLAALTRHLPEAMAELAARPDAAPPLRSVDYELLERVAPSDPERHAFVEARCVFRDCGNLEALAAEAPPDDGGNFVRGNVIARECHDCVLLCEAPRELRVSGLRDTTVAVGAESNVLVVPRSATDGAAAGPELRRCTDEDEVARQAAYLIVDALRAALARRGRAVLVPSTGRTVLGCYARLAHVHRSALDWRRVEVFQMDELEGVSEAMSARSFLSARLLEPLGIRRACLMRDASRAEGLRVERELARAGVDLVVHGLGENGHLGLNEPGSAFDSRARDVLLHDETRRSKQGQFGGGAAPARGLTLGLGTLLGAPQSLLLATGAPKRSALERALFHPVSQEVPASGLRHAARVTVVADCAALPLADLVVR
jgi:mannose-1-phosphate guanylyltransferase/6-phosphogluconolactonase/glucosamine-6-phosphate isomerase/deaminase